jgi:hypothetical protein
LNTGPAGGKGAFADAEIGVSRVAKATAAVRKRTLSLILCLYI